MSRTTRLLLTLAVALVALCATFGSAAAAPRAADTTPPSGNISLERAYQVEKQHLRAMELRFRQAGAFADEVAALIHRLKEHGVDTMPLERACRLPRPQALLTATGRPLATHWRLMPASTMRVMSPTPTGPARRCGTRMPT